MCKRAFLLYLHWLAACSCQSQASNHLRCVINPTFSIYPRRSCVTEYLQIFDIKTIRSYMNVTGTIAVRCKTCGVVILNWINAYLLIRTDTDRRRPYLSKLRLKWKWVEMDNVQVFSVLQWLDSETFTLSCLNLALFSETVLCLIWFSYDLNCRTWWKT